MPNSYDTSHFWRMNLRGPLVPAPRYEKCILCLGSSASYGQNIEIPFANGLAAQIGCEVLNYSAMHASPQAMQMMLLHNSGWEAAQLVILEAVGAHNMTNQFYMVHPRRNDRFIGPKPALLELYPEIDFTEFCFVRHMLLNLALCDFDRFEVVVAELQSVWCEAMVALRDSLPCPIVVPIFPMSARNALGLEPLFVTEQMIEDCGIEGVVCNDLQTGDAAEHEAVANLLAPMVRERLVQNAKGPRKARAHLDDSSAA